MQHATWWSTMVKQLGSAHAELAAPGPSGARLTTHLKQLAQQGLEERGLARPHRSQDAHQPAAWQLHMQAPQHGQLEAGAG
jgi:hypothetical protein